MVHISELANYRVGSVEDVVKVGDEVEVLVTDIDPTGRIRLSRRALLEPADDDDGPQETGADGGREPSFGGARPDGGGLPFGDRPGGDRPSGGGRPSGGRPFGDRDRDRGPPPGWQRTPAPAQAGRRSWPPTPRG